MLGTILQQRYRIDRQLGQGGMGTVYAAYDLHLERDVAIKVLNNESLGTQGRSRLLQEARAVAKLNHPNIVSVFDAQQAEGFFFVVMELIHGKTLRDYKPASQEEVLALTRQICMALDHAHTSGIIHRDLKPENIMLVGSRVKLMDFGLARSAQATDPQDGGMVGTPAYISPEQIQEQTPDARSDLYSLGVLVYELAVGELPFKGTNLFALISQHLSELPTPPRQINPAVDSHLETVILRLLAKDPADRYPSASAVLEELGQDSPIQPPPAIIVSPPRTNLPVQLTSFIGREKEIVTVKSLITAADAHLVTLTGSGGTGKTRLSLQVASQLLDSFPDGVWFVELAPLADPALVPQTVLTTLGLREDPARSVIEILTQYLQTRKVLLVLDNCEHLVQAAAQLVETLAHACQNLRILSSSREALGIAGEQAYHVRSLSTPKTGETYTAENLAQYESARLFAERAKSAAPAFALTAANAPAVAQICARLDGIPLAIELAAARVKMLKPEQIAERLDDRFRLLTGGSRTALPRQQTLRAMIDWSYDLLTEPERVLLRRLSVFAGGWTLEAAETVCQGPGIDDYNVLDPLANLVNKSLVVVDAEEESAETRYRLLETIRQYAREKLTESGEGAPVRDAHLQYFLGLAEKAEDERFGPLFLHSINRFRFEMDNVRAACDWSIKSNPSSGMLLLSSLFNAFTDTEQTYSSMAYKLLPVFLHLPAINRINPVHAKALCVYGFLLTFEAPQQAGSILEEALSIFQSLEKASGIALTTLYLGILAFQNGQAALSKSLAIESLALFRELNDRINTASVLSYLGGMIDTNHYQKTLEYHVEALEVCRNLQYTMGIIRCLDDLSLLELRHCNYVSAKQWLEESLELQKSLLQKPSEFTLRILGELSARTDDNEKALAYFQEGLSYVRQTGGAPQQSRWIYAKLGFALIWKKDFDRAKTSLKLAMEYSQAAQQSIGIVFAMEGFACLHTALSNFYIALQFYEWADRYRIKLDSIRPPYEQTEVDRDLATIRANIDEAAFAAAQEAGRAMSMDEAIALALEATHE